MGITRKGGTHFSFYAQKEQKTRQILTNNELQHI